MTNNQAREKIFNSDTIYQIRDGNVKVFESVYKFYFSRLCAFASNYVSEIYYEEIVQDVMVWLWENRKSLIPEMQLSSLLFTIVKNRCLNEIVHSQIKDEVHRKLKERLESQLEEPDLYLSDELEKLLSDAISNLPPEYREAYRLNRFGHLSYQEIALKEGVSSKTISYRISQALKLLRVACKDYLPSVVMFL